MIPLISIIKIMNRARWITIGRSRCAPRRFITTVIIPPFKARALIVIGGPRVYAIDERRFVPLLIRRLSFLTRRDREVIDFTRSRVKNYSELTNLGN